MTRIASPAFAAVLLAGTAPVLAHPGHGANGADHWLASDHMAVLIALASVIAATQAPRLLRAVRAWLRSGN